MTQCGAALRDLGVDASSMEETANRIMRYLFDSLTDENGERVCVLSRFFITMPYSELDNDNQRHAEKLLGDVPDDEQLRCQTLLATVGAEPAWNDRRKSNYYKNLPMTPEIFDANPMYVQFAETFGVVIERSITPNPALIAELEQSSYNVFHVPVYPPSFPGYVLFVLPQSGQSLCHCHHWLSSLKRSWCLIADGQHNFSNMSFFLERGLCLMNLI